MVLFQIGSGQNIGLFGTTLDLNIALFGADKNRYRGFKDEKLVSFENLLVWLTYGSKIKAITIDTTNVRGVTMHACVSRSLSTATFYCSKKVEKVFIISVKALRNRKQY